MKVILEMSERKGGVYEAVQPVSLSWLNIQVVTKPQKDIYNCYKNEQKPKEIIKNVSGEVKTGQLLAIMGASGAGKTSLLNVLTGRNLSKLGVQGQVLVNGQVVTAAQIASISSYIQQHDMFHAMLTVREHLIFQALLRMDRNMSRREKIDSVDHVIQKFNLTKCMNTKIGGAYAFKGISGGEMKRLSFASEVLTNPSVMFCDEPTSGLDSFMAENIVQVLKDMAAEGRTIICTIHQPSSQVFELFEHLLLMADGRAAFMGTISETRDFFSSIGFVCPDNYNPADFYINELAITSDNMKEDKIRVTEICDKYLKSDYAPQLAIEIDNNQLVNTFEERDDESEIESGYRVGYWSQLVALFWRSYLLVIRSPQLLKVRIMRTLILALFLGTIYHKQYAESPYISNINAALFLLVQNNTFLNTLFCVQIFCMETPIFLREHHNRMYGVLPYFVATSFIQLPILCTSGIIFIAVIYYMIGFNAMPAVFFTCIAINVVLTLVSSSFGYFISAISRDIATAMALLTPMVMPMILLGGLFLNTNSIPWWLTWAKYLSFIHYGFESMVVNQWKDIDYIPCINANISAASLGQCYPNGAAVIAEEGFYEDNLYWDPIIMLAMTGLFLFLAYVGLVFKAKKKN